MAVEVGTQPCPLVSAPGLNQAEGAASVTPEQLLEGLGIKTATVNATSAQATACKPGEAGVLTEPRNGPREQEPEAHRRCCRGWLLQQQLGDRHILPVFCPLYSRL